MILRSITAVTRKPVIGEVEPWRVGTENAAGPATNVRTHDHSQNAESISGFNGKIIPIYATRDDDMEIQAPG